MVPIAVGSKDKWPDAFYWDYFAVRECSQATLEQAIKTVNLSYPCFTKAGNDLTSFMATNPFQAAFLATPAQTGAGSSAGMVANGKAAMELQGDWETSVIPALTSDKNIISKLGWFPFPSVPGGAGSSTAALDGGDGFSCTTRAPEPACADFLQYIDSTAVQEKLVKQANIGLPANPAAQAVLSNPALKTAAAAPRTRLRAGVLRHRLPTTAGQALDTAVANFFAGKASAPSVGNSVKASSGSDDRVASTSGGRAGAIRPSHRCPAAEAGRGLAQAGGADVVLVPPLVLFIGFVLVPIFFAAWYGLFNWSGYGPLSDFVGFQNYSGVLTGPVFHQSLVHNVIIAVLSLVIQLPISIALALLLNRRMRGQTFLRLAVFAPYVLSEATTAVLWLLLLEPGGFVDELLKAVGLGGLVHQWLASTTLVLYTLFVVITWKYIGFGIVLLLAGLQGIPAELREAAAIDGASPWQMTRRITLPLLGPTVRIWIFLSVIGSLQLFDLVWIMTLGGPANASSTMLTYMYYNGVERYQFGYGSAVAVVLFIISFVFALAYQRFALRRDTAGALTRAVG